MTDSHKVMRSIDDDDGGSAVDAFKSVAYARGAAEADGADSSSHIGSFMHATTILPLLADFCAEPTEGIRLQQLKSLVR